MSVPAPTNIARRVSLSQARPYRDLGDVEHSHRVLILGMDGMIVAYGAVQCRADFGRGVSLLYVHDEESHVVAKVERPTHGVERHVYAFVKSSATYRHIAVLPDHTYDLEIDTVDRYELAEWRLCAEQLVGYAFAEKCHLAVVVEVTFVKQTSGI